MNSIGNLFVASLIVLIACTSGKDCEKFPILACENTRRSLKATILPSDPLILSNPSFSSNLAAPNQDSRIVGGFRVNIKRVPWQASVYFHNRHLCGGSIISNRWILTAAFCLANNPMHLFDVKVGATDWLNEGKLYHAEQKIVHERYTGRATNDFDYGLLRVSKDIIFSDIAQPIQMPNIGDADVASGTTCLVSGWGWTKNNSESSQYLRAVEVPKVDHKLCLYAYDGMFPITERLFCAGLYDEGGKDCKLTMTFFRIFSGKTVYFRKKLIFSSKNGIFPRKMRFSGEKYGFFKQNADFSRKIRFLQKK